MCRSKRERKREICSLFVYRDVSYGIYVHITEQLIYISYKGLGMEVVKNLVLAGPGALTLHDNEPCQIKDLGSNFYLTPEDVGKTRASAVVNKVKELNETVRVSVHEGELTEDVVKSHDCVVFLNQPREKCIKWNNFCRSRSIDGTGMCVCVCVCAHMYVCMYVCGHVRECV